MQYPLTQVGVTTRQESVLVWAVPRAQYPPASWLVTAASGDAVGLAAQPTRAGKRCAYWALWASPGETCWGKTWAHKKSLLFTVTDMSSSRQPKPVPTSRYGLAPVSIRFFPLLFILSVLFFIRVVTLFRKRYIPIQPPFHFPSNPKRHWCVHTHHPKAHPQPLAVCLPPLHLSGVTTTKQPPPLPSPPPTHTHNPPESLSFTSRFRIDGTHSQYSPPLLSTVCLLTSPLWSNHGKRIQEVDRVGNDLRKVSHDGENISEDEREKKKDDLSEKKGGTKGVEAPLSIR